MQFRLIFGIEYFAGTCHQNVLLSVKSRQKFPPKWTSGLSALYSTSVFMVKR